MLTNLFLGQTAEEKLYIEDVFSTWLYTGNGSTQTITNGIDLAGKGGLVWLKKRDAAGGHTLFDTERGATKALLSHDTGGQSTFSTTLTSFSSTGFALGSGFTNDSGTQQASWTFRKAPKFFDVVTYTGNGSGSQEISHSLGSAPGFVVAKCTSTTGNWGVWHRNAGGNNITGISLNATNAAAFTADNLNSYFTSTTFRPGNVYDHTTTGMNENGKSYVAYLFAHDTTADGVIQCGSFTTDGSGNATVNLGWEPQFILWKSSSNAQNWYMHDSMRGMGTYIPQTLYPHLSNAESTYNAITINSTGFSCRDNASRTYIYLAIRRGPMRVPTDATKVFQSIARNGTGAASTMTAGFAPDAVILSNRNRAGTNYNPVYDKLRGNDAILSTNNLGAEQSLSGSITQYTNTGVTLGSDAYGNINASGATYINWILGRAPGFFDVVCYTASYSANPQISHNLGVVPELLIAKSRTGTRAWYVAGSVLGGKWLNLNDSAGSFTSTAYTGTATYFKAQDLNWPDGSTHVAYLFASCPGVSKVGTYTGTGTTKQIDCGFTNGARFVLIKRTDSTGDWTVWDTARGIVSGNDPYLLLNSTAAEVTNTDYIDPLSTGFEISSTAPAAINANGGTFVFLAIA